MNPVYRRRSPHFTGCGEPQPQPVDIITESTLRTSVDPFKSTLVSAHGAVFGVGRGRSDVEVDIPGEHRVHKPTGSQHHRNDASLDTPHCRKRRMNRNGKIILTFSHGSAQAAAIGKRGERAVGRTSGKSYIWDAPAGAERR